MALALDNLQKIDMPLNKETNQMISNFNSMRRNNSSAFSFQVNNVLSAFSFQVNNVSIPELKQNIK